MVWILGRFRRVQIFLLSPEARRSDGGLDALDFSPTNPNEVGPLDVQKGASHPVLVEGNDLVSGSSDQQQAKARLSIATWEASILHY